MNFYNATKLRVNFKVKLFFEYKKKINVFLIVFFFLNQKTNCLIMHYINTATFVVICRYHNLENFSTNLMEFSSKFSQIVRNVVNKKIKKLCLKCYKAQSTCKS